MAVAFYRFIEAKRWNAIDFCQIAIQDNPDTANCANHSVDLLNGNRRLCFLRYG